ncbi:MAG: sugar phosphate nucleotidyltransferase [Clostridia bacterium]|nr:sugar phosphate nucleotidyltransferase [Clostridia bacterium]
MDLTLVVMAAGMGSRFGGLKQMAPMGPEGQAILDFSIYDAAKAGFTKAVFVIKEEMQQEFDELIGQRARKRMQVEYAYQKPDSFLEDPYPEGRTKPWGTAHAALCAKDKVNTPFAVINADDFYGATAYQLVADHLKQGGGPCMAGYLLGNTLTENGTVCRGICRTEQGRLLGVTEHTDLDRNSGFSDDTVVSMNFWGLWPEFFDVLEREFHAFTKTLTDPLKQELYLPAVIDGELSKGMEVQVFVTPDRWHGVTYREDTPQVQRALKALWEEGNYIGL